MNRSMRFCRCQLRNCRAGPDAEQSGERAEERGQGRLADQPQAGDRGEHVDEELAGW
ncbi:hypothetical protein SVIOM74S_10170 [Streptomyces violarus]